jgi:hypothetical protein
MQKRRFLILPLVGLLLSGLVTGCGHISGGAAPSTEPLIPGSYREIGPVSGEDCVGYILGLIPISDGNETKDAIAAALKKSAGATALVKVTADTYSQNYIVYARVCTQVHGVAVAPK